MSTENNWKEICHIDAIVPNAGRCALVEGEQVAIFRVSKSGNDELYAIHNHDPFSKANVLSRGIVGSLSERVVVASPIYKQHFCLQTGECLEDEATQLKTWQVRVENNMVQLSA
ncbi:MAG: nitrite reductase small subunit NirD [Oceanicoccus sp.]|uniref:nitrite reductase small subunit NirD n=1 Tax=Oceanicoccus sp. TaxID=2691044 RepID=UPI00261D73AE|nr:nitrite reductase small subunit NirD [Oceanicoccus sp.]MCP3907274.1 nitrite reductase small subunit NirD [Oceanicoccus sp.]MDG1772272.1 nitrite reductase small subunit NirD [Oceanicoccus sp.]